MITEGGISLAFIIKLWHSEKEKKSTEIENEASPRRVLQKNIVPIAMAANVHAILACKQFSHIQEN